MAVASLPVEEGGPPIQFLPDGLGNGLVLRGDDQHHFRVVEAVHHRVDDLSDDEHRHSGVQCISHIPEHQSRQHHHKGVKAHGNLTDGYVPPAQLQQPHQNIRAAGGGAGYEHDSQAQAADHPAVERADQRLHLRGRKSGDQVNQHRADYRSQGGAQEETPADLHASQQKQRKVKKNGQSAHAAHTQQLHNHHGETRDAAGVHFIGLQKQGKPRRKQGAPQKRSKNPAHLAF